MVRCFYRSDATVGALMQVYITDNIRVGYAFDTGINKLQKDWVTAMK